MLCSVRIDGHTANGVFGSLVRTLAVYARAAIRTIRVTGGMHRFNHPTLLCRSCIYTLTGYSVKSDGGKLGVTRCSGALVPTIANA
jgi:hypothetical protein